MRWWFSKIIKGGCFAFVILPYNFFVSLLIAAVLLINGILSGPRRRAEQGVLRNT